MSMLIIWHAVLLTVMTVFLLPAMQGVLARPEMGLRTKRKWHAILGGLVFLFSFLGIASVYIHKHFKHVQVDHVQGSKEQVEGQNSISRKRWKYIHKIGGYTTLGLLLMQTISGVGKYFRRKLVPIYISRLHGQIGNFVYYLSFTTMSTSLLFWKKYGNFVYVFSFLFFIFFIFNCIVTRCHLRRPLLESQVRPDTTIVEP